MNLIHFLAMKLYQGSVYIDDMVNSTGVLVHSKTNFVVVIQNQLLSRKPSMRQLILQDRHLNYREIEITLGIRVTSIYSILYEHLHLHLYICRNRITRKSQI